MSFDPTKPVQDRSGNRARIIEANALGEKPIIALIAGRDGGEFVRRVYANGRVIESIDHVCDLVNIPQKRSGWVNCYRSIGSTGFLCGWKTYPTQKDAEAGIDRDGEEWLCAVHITFEEGEGL